MLHYDELDSQIRRVNNFEFMKLAQKVISVIRGIPIIPGIILASFLICGIFGNLIAPHDPNQQSLAISLMPPFWIKGGSISYLLGTDALGRDILSRLIVGTSVSLQVGLVATLLAGFIGALLALVSGYLGGLVDTIIMRMVDVMLSLPYLLIAIVLAVVLGPSKNNVIAILAILLWPSYARILRSEVLRIKEIDFVRLAVVAGASRSRIMLTHIFPNIVNSLVVLITLQLGMVIILESSLSFLGVGVPPPDPAWGSMLADGRDYISSAWWLCLWPGVAIVLVVLSCNLLGDWLRIRLDPKFRQL
jgi:peptide/nickel transport system permease protein